MEMYHVSKISFQKSPFARHQTIPGMVFRDLVKGEGAYIIKPFNRVFTIVAPTDEKLTEPSPILNLKFNNKICINRFWSQLKSK